MARLPDTTELGARPAPRSARPTFGVSNAGVAQRAAADPELIQAAERLESAGRRIQNREDAIESLRAVRSYRDQATSIMREVMSDQDLSSPQTSKGFAKTLDELEKQTLGSLGGTPENAVRVAQQLQSLRFGMVEQVANASVQAQQKMVAAELGEYMSDLSNDVFENPGNFLPAMNEFMDRVEGLPGNPEFKASQRQAALGIFAHSAIQRMIASGAIQDVPGAMNDVMDLLEHEGVADALGPKGVAAVRNQVLMAQRPKNENLVPVHDPSSPTGQVWSLESQAVGKPAPKKVPLIDNSQRADTKLIETLSREEGEIIGEYRKAAAKAPLILAETSRMRAALESGRFIPGSFAGLRHNLARLADFFGASDGVKKIVGDAATADTLDAAAATLGIEVAQKLGRLTNMALLLGERSLPSLTRTPGGNEILAQVLDRKARRDLQIDALVDDYRSKGTFYPQGERSFFQAVRDLDETDPIITEEMADRIREEVAAAPKSFSDIINEAEGKEPRIGTQEEYDNLEPGTVFTWGPTGVKARKPGAE